MPEAVELGLAKATSLPFRPGARKVIVLVGDAPPHKEDIKVANYIARQFAANGGVVHTLYAGGSAADAFRGIAAAGGGRAESLENHEEVLRKVLHLTIGHRWAEEIDVLRAELAERRKAEAEAAKKKATPSEGSRR